MDRQAIITTHEQIILQMRVIEAEIEQALREKRPDWRAREEERNELYVQIEPLIEAYWNQIPAAVFGKCPFCGEEVIRLFDAVDLKGFWWMERTSRRRPQPKACAHFLFTLGSLNTHGIPVEGGLFDCRPGPDAPYVIPELLSQPDIQAVINSIDMECGYTYFPISYFSSTPDKPRIDVKAIDQPFDSYDYNLRPWVEKGKLELLDDTLLHLESKERPQLIQDNKLYFL